MSVDDDYLIPASRKAEAAEALYAATDFIDHFCLNQTDVSDEARLTIPGPYIRALIDARRKARGE